jgi:hypothetical protein
MSGSIHAEINPGRLASLSLCRAANALEQATADPSAWFFIILDLNRALTAALVAALSAFSTEGAYDDNLRSQWLEYFENSRTNPNAQPPTSNRVPFLEKLLTMAEAGSRSVQPLHLTQEQRADIEKLNDFRNDLEHVKPESWSLDTTGLPRIAKNVAAAFEPLFESFQHQLELDEVERINAALGKLKVGG